MPFDIPRATPRPTPEPAPEAPRRFTASSAPRTTYSRLQPEGKPAEEPEETAALPPTGPIPPPRAAGYPSWPLWIASALAILAVLALALFARPHPHDDSEDAAVAGVSTTPGGPLSTPGPLPSSEHTPAGAQAGPAAGRSSGADKPSADGLIAAPFHSSPSDARQGSSPQGPSDPRTRPDPRTPSQPQAHTPSRAPDPRSAQPAATNDDGDDDPPATSGPAGQTDLARTPTSSSALPLQSHLTMPALPRGRSLHGPYFLVSSGVMASHLLQAPEPDYPTIARLMHLQGQVVLQAVISTEGKVMAAKVLNGHRLLRGAAISAVRRWQYKPYVLDGHPVNVATIVTVDFRQHK